MISVPASGQDPGACTAALFAAGALPDLAAPAQAAGPGTVAQITAGRAAGTNACPVASKVWVHLLES